MYIFRNSKNGCVYITDAHVLGCKGSLEGICNGNQVSNFIVSCLLIHANGSLSMCSSRGMNVTL